MIVSNCPRCAEVFRVPDAEVPEDAYAECPWCQETFPIVEVLHRLPPLLHVIAADGETLHFSRQQSVMAGGLAAQPGQQDGQADEGAGTELHASEYYDGGIGTLADGELDDSGNKTVSEETVAETLTDVRLGGDDSSVDDFDVMDPDDTWEQGEPSDNVRAVAPMKVTPAPAPARKSRSSTARTWISIVLGGVAAGPLAVAILWVLTLFGVEVDLGFWPLNGHSAVVKTDRVAAAPVPLSKDNEPAPSAPLPGATGRLLSGRGDVASSPTDSETAADGAGGSEAENSDDAALPENSDAASPLEFAMPMAATAATDPDSTSDNAVAENAVATTESSPLLSNPFGLPVENRSEIGDAQDELAVGSAKQDATVATTVPPMDADTTRDSADADAIDVVNAEPTLPALDEAAVRVGPDPAEVPAAELATRAAKQPQQSSTKRVANGVKPAAGVVEPTAGLQPKRSDQPSVADVAKVTPLASDATIDSQPRAMNIKPQLKPKPNVETEPEELVQAATKAGDMLDQLARTDRGNPDKTKLLLRDAYIAIASVGAVARTDSKSVSGLMRRVASSPDLEVWGHNTAAWLALGKRRPTEGVFLIGKPLSDAAGQRIEISDDDVVSLTDDSKRLPTTDRVLGLGRIVEAGSGPTISLVAVESLP